MTAIILAGGKATRLGCDKTQLELNGLPLLKNQIALLKKLFKKIIVVTDKPRLRYGDVKTVRDVVPGRGPLGGIYSGLVASASFYNFVVACDMPNTNLQLLKYMIKSSSGFDVVVPRLKKGYEPLFAIYSKRCIPAIEKVLHNDGPRIISFFNKIKLKEIKEKEIKRFGEPEFLFFNINTPCDYEKLLSS